MVPLSYGLLAAALQHAGDFNGDGAHDLAIAVLNETGAGIRGGLVHTLYGRPGVGLGAFGNQRWSQATPGVAENPEDKDLFGWAQASADFNADGFADLALSAAEEDLNGLADAGVVHVLYGGASGLQAAGSQLWRQGSNGLPSEPNTFELFGHALAAGDFDGDGYADLAIGVPRQDFSVFLRGIGVVHVLFGGPAGLSAARTQLVLETNAPNLVDQGDQFGFALATGDFNGDGRADLAVGNVYDQTAGGTRAGSVEVFYGAAGGLATPPQQWDQDTPGIPEQGEVGDKFGAVLASGDFNGDGRDELAIGVSDEWLGSIAGGGQVHVLFGSPGGLSAAGNQVWHLDAAGIPGQADHADHLGNALAAADFDADGADDLAVGVSGSNEFIDDGGAVLLLYGRPGAGLTAAGSRLIGQGQNGIEGTAEIDDLFGEHLRAGDFDGDGYADLAIGAPHEDLRMVFDAGAVHVVYGGGSGLSAARNQVWHQDQPGIPGRPEREDWFGRF